MIIKKQIQKTVAVILTGFLVTTQSIAHTHDTAATGTIDTGFYSPTLWMPLNLHSQVFELDQRANEELFQSTPQKKLIHIGDHFALNGGVNIQGVFGNRPGTSPFPTPANNSLILRAAYLGLASYFNSWSRAYVSLNYEPYSISTATGEPFTAPEVEQAYIQLNNPNRHFRFDLGKQYLPFSIYEHYPIVATLPQRLSEINKVAAVFSFKENIFFASGYAFSLQGNSNGYNNAPTNQIANGGAEVGIRRINKQFGYEADIGYLNDIAETRYIYFLIKATHGTVGAISGDLNFNIKRFGVITSVVDAIEPFSPLDITYDGSGAKPFSYEAKINYVIEVHHHPLVPQIGYEASQQSLFLSDPLYLYTASLEYWINRYLSTTIDFLRSKNYASGNIGTYATSATTIGTIRGNGKWNDVVILELASKF